jgi:hypothetical protein
MDPLTTFCPLNASNISRHIRKQFLKFTESSNLVVFFLGSFPFDCNRYENFIKATVDDNGAIIYFTEPEYHGDPVSDKGILCYTVFWLGIS